MSEDLCLLGVKQAGIRMRQGTLSPIELTKAFLDRIERLNPLLHCYITVCPDRALADAAKAESELAAGQDRGLLHGIPVALKDTISTAGILTTGCSRRLAGFVPDADASIVRRLVEGGAVLLGKAATFELALGGPSPDIPYPLARNPWNLDGYTGGSSSGSCVAVAAGMAMAAIGTDTGGSVRNPAAHCGVTGLKPTFGWMDMKGIQPLSPLLDHVGTVTWSAEDAFDVLAGLGGTEAGNSRQSQPAARNDLKGLQVGVVDAWYTAEAKAGEEMRGAMASAIGLFRDLGTDVDTVELSPLADYEACLLVIILADAYALFGSDLARAPQLFGQIFRDRVGMGAFLSSSDYARAIKLRAALTEEMERAFHRFDVLVTAGMLAPLMLSDIPRHAMFKGRYITGPWNITGDPAISVRCGMAANGLPLGMQIAAGKHKEESLLRAAIAFDGVSGLLDRRPSL